MNSLPAGIAQSVEAQLGDRIARTSSVSGGCIAHALRLDLAAGGQAFLKWAKPAQLPHDLFAAEAYALEQLRRCHAVRVPTVLHVHSGHAGTYILLEWLAPGRRTAAGERQLGAALAQLHQQTAAAYGWDSDNFIGALPQSNQWSNDWPGFWRAQRLEPQLELATARLAPEQRRRVAAVADAAAEIIGDAVADGPSLLHGDLWGGNVHYLADGSAALIDPSSYFGQREVDLAMSELFGGFGREFYEAYEAVWPTAPGRERRRWLYQLYYVLVHVNLFGGSYAEQAMALVERLGY